MFNNDHGLHGEGAMANCTPMANRFSSTSIPRRTKNVPKLSHPLPKYFLCGEVPVQSYRAFSNTFVLIDDLNLSSFNYFLAMVGSRSSYRHAAHSYYIQTFAIRGEPEASKHG